MLPAFRTKAIATATAIALALTAAAPAQALGKNERDLLKGLAAVAIVGVILNEVGKNNRAQAQPAPAPQVRYEQPHPKAHKNKHERREDRWQDRSNDRHDYDTRYTPPNQGRIIGQGSYQPQGGYQTQSSVYATPAARVFATYNATERRLIQRQLARYGYYTGGIDGAFGPGTYTAIRTYARAINQPSALDSNGGIYNLLDTLIVQS